MSKHCNNDFYLFFYDRTFHSVAFGDEKSKECLSRLVSSYDLSEVDFSKIHCFKISTFVVKHLLNFFTEYIEE